ncbi:MAG: hypothetical protein AAF944_08780 [Bacteroidota bacterium]
MTVEQAIKAFYQRYDFGEDGGTNEKWAWIKFGFFSVPIPNLESRRKAVYLHDVSHIVTGHDTSWKGESAVSAWEVASGGWNKHYFPWLLTLWAMGLGVTFYPQFTLRAFKRGRKMRNALTSGLIKDEIFQLPVTKLQERISNQPTTNKNPYLWGVISFLVFALPFVGGSAAIRAIVKRWVNG